MKLGVSRESGIRTRIRFAGLPIEISVDQNEDTMLVDWADATDSHIEVGPPVPAVNLGMIKNPKRRSKESFPTPKGGKQVPQTEKPRDTGARASGLERPYQPSYCLPSKIRR